MDLVITYTRPDGGVSVIHPAPQARIKDETDEGFAARIAAKDAPPGAAVTVLSKRTLPSRRFRNAWAQGAAAVMVDVVKARVQVLAELRRLRDELLTESDRLKAKADDVGNGQQQREVKDYRQKLRDLPAAVEGEIAALTVDRLEVYAPAFPAKPAV